jgi:hypothetical protein
VHLGRGQGDRRRRLRARLLSFRAVSEAMYATRCARSARASLRVHQPPGWSTRMPVMERRQARTCLRGSRGARRGHSVAAFWRVGFASTANGAGCDLAPTPQPRWVADRLACSGRGQDLKHLSRDKPGRRSWRRTLPGTLCRPLQRHPRPRTGSRCGCDRRQASASRYRSRSLALADHRHRDLMQELDSPVGL